MSDPRVPPLGQRRRTGRPSRDDQPARLDGGLPGDVRARHARRYAERVRGGGPVTAGFISGAETALLHGHTPDERLAEGTVPITGTTAAVDGYGAELERTMFVGEPTEEDAHYFELIREAQPIAIGALGPGVPVADVDRAV